MREAWLRLDHVKFGIIAQVHFKEFSKCLGDDAVPRRIWDEYPVLEEWITTQINSVIVAFGQAIGEVEISTCFQSLECFAFDGPESTDWPETEIFQVLFDSLQPQEVFPKIKRKYDVIFLFEGVNLLLRCRNRAVKLWLNFGLIPC